MPRTRRLLVLVVLAVGVQLAAAGADVWLDRTGGVTRDLMVLDRLTFLAFAGVGALVLHRHPRHRLGALALGLGLLFAVDRGAEAYGLLGVVAGWPLPGAWTVYWISSWTWVLLLEGIILVFLWMPDGALPSRRWRPVAFVAALAAVALWCAAAFVPVPILDEVPDATNPYGIGGAAGEALLRLGELAFPWFAGALGIAAVVPLTRWRRADRRERRQLAGFALAALLFAPTFIGWQLTMVLGGPEWLFLALDLASTLALLALPASIWVAVLGFRLFDVERTLVVALSSAIVAIGVAALYGGVLGLAGVTAGRRAGSDVGVAVAVTVVVALALEPAYARVRRRAVALVLPAATAEPARVRVLTLGTFQVLCDGVQVPTRAWGSRKARTLLKVLVAREGRPTSRDVLMEVLWPESDPAVTGPRLSVMLSTVRSVLERTAPEPGAGAVLHAERDVVCLNVDLVEVDAWAFLADIADAERALADGDDDTARHLLERALPRYGGDVLEEDAYEAWVAPLRDRCREAFVSGSRQLASLCTAVGQYDLAVHHLGRVLELDRYDERAHIELVRVLVAAGRHGEARRRHQAYVSVAVELGLEPASFPVPAHEVRAVAS